MAPPGEMPSNNLWVGNLTPDVTEADLTALFQKYGPVDSVTSYSARGFAFLYFKNINDAKEAKDALQGSFFHGNPLRIEFAKPAKPCKSLWVAGISKSVSKEELEDQFKGFGKIQEFKFIRDRNTAYIDFTRLEDAAEALKNMNGKKVGGEQIRVDYLRSQPARREQGPEFREMRDGQFPNRSIGHPDTRVMPQDFVRNYSDPMHAGFKRQHPFQLPAGQSGQPSKVLCISYPPSVHVDEDMLHNAMILFGEIDGIKTFYDRNYSLVEFRSIEEAQRAKEGLQGKLFNDPRITIEYSSSGPAPGRDFLEYHPSIMGPAPDFYPNENPFQPAQMGLFGHSRPMLASNVPGHLPPYGIHGPDIPARPLSMQGRFDHVISGPEFTDSPVLRKLRDTSPHTVIGGPNWKQSSPTPGVLSSPSGEQKPPNRSALGGWDVFDSSQLQRETKRSRIDGALPYDSSLPPKRTDGRAPGHDYIWRGVIAKGGTPVCHARCVPIGERIESEIPEVVNCSARTGLDMLTKHYADAVGFNIVYFLPDSEEDFASYTEFLRYLGSKDRAGVAKFGDGTTMFLVPPSDFLTKVLKVVGPERLYGVVLKFAHHIPGNTSLPPESNQPQYVDAPRITSSQAAYDAMPSMERVSQMNYNQVTREDLKLPSKEVTSLTDAHPANPAQPSNTAAYPLNPVHQSNTSAPTQAGVTLTPELIATLAKMLPANKLSSAEGATMPAGASGGMPASDAAVAPGKVQQQSWRYEHQAPGQAADHMAQFGSQFNNQMQVLPQLQAHPAGLNTPNHYSQGATGFSQMQEHSLNLQAQGGPPQTLTSTMISQSTQLSAQPHVDRHLQLGTHQDAVSGSGTHSADALGLYGSSVSQQPTNLASLPNQTHGANVPQPQAGMPVASGMGLATQMHQLQSALYGSVQEGPESEVDKNERYQATLLFAANLLSQIHKQKPSSQSGQGSGNL
ncbi:flowering time control protein FPA isoform X1 [Nicotiana sylvestris]|uniref:Flowering time control protein FPA isoform X1 n=1 Tax=Nicotiana sylvestris TaxID=4096 RepID=A0A1U7XKJ5_NICSY|nr:PREDICTED: flowering time control protein FPA isoform X1 [Nicotiana sylvestris]